MVWYSAEVTGTIMVQSIPVMRPIMQDIKTTLTSKRLTELDFTRSSYAPSHGIVIQRQRSIRISNHGDINPIVEQFMLEEADSDTGMSRIKSSTSLSLSEVDRAIQASRTKPLDWSGTAGYKVTITGSAHSDDFV